MSAYIDLHLHLDGSLSVSTARTIAELQDISLPMNDKELKKLLKCPDNCQDLNDYLKCFDLPLTLLQTTEGISEAVYLLQEELRKQGLIYAEIRFAPQLHCNRGLTQDEVVKAAIEGLNRSPFYANLILCCMRGNQNHEENMETVRIARKSLRKGVVAIDLAGAEGLFPTRDFAEIFELASEINVPFTIHAGEADGPKSVKRAVEFGAKRIGHGVRSYEDRILMDMIADQNITLEFCPKSNLDTCIFPSLKDYPIKQFLECGIPITINTDNMAVSDTTVEKEIQNLVETFGFTEKQIYQFEMNAVNASFADKKLKKELQKIIKSKFAV